MEPQSGVPHHVPVDQRKEGDSGLLNGAEVPGHPPFEEVHKKVQVNF